MVTFSRSNGRCRNKQKLRRCSFEVGEKKEQMFLGRQVIEVKSVSQLYEKFET